MILLDVPTLWRGILVFFGGSRVIRSIRLGMEMGL
jgi:hypothetical protein